MIYFCADDYGLNDSASSNILRCVDEGVLNKVSVFPNLGAVNLSEFNGKRKVRLSLHINLVEGKCMANAREVEMIAEKSGNFKYTFGGLLKLSLLHPRKLEEQLYREIKAQVLFWKSVLPEGMPFCVDSHQHTHMIPVVFNALLRVLTDEKIVAEYIRIPAEPVMPYIKTPSLYFTYSPINMIKQWLLKFLWQINKKRASECKIPTSLFMGILFSGKMDAGRVEKLLPKYEKLAKKYGTDAEILFHPGYIEKENADLKEKNIVFEKFYFSENRKTEFESAMKIKKGSVN